MILLDSDVIVDALREHPPAVKWFGETYTVGLTVSALTVMEVIEGARDAAGMRRARSLLSTLTIQYPDEKIIREATELLAALRLSHGLGHSDAIIAATALQLGVPLHSFNRKHFAVVPGLYLLEPYVR